MKTQNNYKKGITLFIAVLVASVATLFSFAISDIALREVILSQTSKDSQISFYAANTGIECALFWDLKKDSFKLGDHSITCNWDTKVARVLDLPGGGETWTLRRPLTFSLPENGDDDAPCFIIDTVEKEIERDGENNITSIKTEIIVKGYNTCDTDSPRRLERALKVKY